MNTKRLWSLLLWTPRPGNRTIETVCWTSKDKLADGVGPRRRLVGSSCMCGSRPVRTPSTSYPVFATRLRGVASSTQAAHSPQHPRQNCVYTPGASVNQRHHLIPRRHDDFLQALGYDVAATVLADHYLSTIPQPCQGCTPRSTGGVAATMHVAMASAWQSDNGQPTCARPCSRSEHRPP